MDTATGGLTLNRVVPAGNNPSFVAFDPMGRNLYCCNDIGNYQGRASGSVTSFAFDPAAGNLTQLNVQPTEGTNPAHVAVDPTGKFVYAANYSGGSVTALPVNDDGSLGAPTSVYRHTGTRNARTEHRPTDDSCKARIAGTIRLPSSPSIHRPEL